jgi:uncharacterized protein (DUF488 family)
VPAVFTVGHSTRTLQELIALLEENGVKELVDVRRFPGSRRYPHFSRDPLSAALGERRIAYRHEPDLGGHREPRPDSPHTAWRVAAFRGYADHMESAAFQSALSHVVTRASLVTCAVMCAEASPDRCHRQLLADALLARGLEVRHILAPGHAVSHTLLPAARVDVTGRVIYDRPYRRPSTR